MILDQIPFVPDTDGLLRRLGFPADSDFAEEILELAARTAPVGRPKVVFREAYVTARGADTVAVDGVTFTSRVLRGHLEGVERVFPYVATCGVEFDALLAGSDDDFLKFALDCIKEQALWAASTCFGTLLEERYGLSHRAAMHPGSGDADIWPLPQQAELFSLLGDVERQIGVQLNDSFLMHPNKTVSGLYFPTEVSFTTCQLCHREVCPNRQAPFDEVLWREKHLVG